MPPETVMVALPVPPLHKTLLTAVEVARAEGWLIVIEFVLVQPLASVTVTVLAPAFNEDITEVV